MRIGTAYSCLKQLIVQHKAAHRIFTSRALKYTWRPRLNEADGVPVYILSMESEDESRQITFMRCY